MRIALVALHFAEYAARMALAIAPRHEVLLVLRSDNAKSELSQELKAEVERKVVLREVDLPKLRNPRILASLASIIRTVRRFCPDVVHFQEANAAHVGVPLLALRRSSPVVLEVHDPTPHSGGLAKDGWEWQVLRWLRRRADRVIGHGSRMVAEIAALDRELADRIDDVPIGILGAVSVDEDVSGCEPNSFLFFGRVEAYKGIGYLLDAGDVLRARGHQFRLIVAGTGRVLDQYRTRIAARPWVKLLDRYIGAAEVPGLFRRALAVVLPYTDATQSAVIAMAFAASRPAIATRVGGLPDVVVDGETGLLVPPRDVTALADAMEKLLLDRALRDALAVGAARFAKDRLSWPRIADLLHAAYSRALRDPLAAASPVDSRTTS